MCIKVGQQASLHDISTLSFMMRLNFEDCDNDERQSEI